MISNLKNLTKNLYNLYDAQNIKTFYWNIEMKTFKINFDTLQNKFWLFNLEHEFGPNYETALNK